MKCSSSAAADSDVNGSIIETTQHARGFPQLATIALETGGLVKLQLDDASLKDWFCVSVRRSERESVESPGTRESAKAAKGRNAVRYEVLCSDLLA